MRVVVSVTLQHMREVPELWVQKCFHQSLDLQLQQNHIKRDASRPAFP